MTQSTMESNLDQAAAAFGAAQFLKARVLTSGLTTVLDRGVSTKELAETLAELAEEFDGNVAAAAAALWAMDEAERLELLGLDGG